MRFILPLTCLLLIYSCEQQQQQQFDPGSALKPHEEFYLLRNFPNMESGAEGYLQALEQARSMATQRGDAPSGFDALWTNKGPDNIGGRVNTLIRHPADSTMLFSGLTAGGIFKSVNGGASWYPVFDDQPALSISFIQVHPTDPSVIYAGTGDPNISSYVFLGQGLFRSVDYGESWDYVGLKDVGILSDMAFDPLHPDTLYVGSMGIPMRRGQERGLYRSYDGGANWEKVLFLSDEAGITDILVSPDNPSIVFACGWHRVRNQAESIVNGNMSRLYRSLDGGNTWAVVKNGLPDEPLSRSGLAWSQGQLFVLFVASNQNLKGIYRSPDHGNSWTVIPTDQDMNGLPGNALGGFGWYFGKIAVNPLDANDLFVLGVDLWRSQNGGLNWFKATPDWWVFSVHADKHDLSFYPGGRIDLATDGGAYTSADGGITWMDLDNFPASQFYRIALNPHDPAQSTGGLQDNGTVTGWQDPMSWQRLYGADGFQPAFHPTFPGVIYAEYQGGGLVVTTNNGEDWDDFTEGINPNDRVGWDAPYFISVHPPYPMYHGTNRIYRNTDHFTAAWVQISDLLTDTVKVYHPGTHVVTALGESPLVSGTVLAGTGDGHLWITQDDGQQWTDITPGLPERYVTDCQGSPSQVDRVFVSHSGYRYNEFVSHIHRSDDAGQSWIDLSGDLPPLGINTFTVIPSTGDSILFVGTDAGVYGTIDGGTAWFKLGTGMPDVPVYDMAFEETTQTLVVGTHARSLFTLSLEEILTPMNTAVNQGAGKVGFWKLLANPAGSQLILSGPTTRNGHPLNLTLLDLQGKAVLVRTISDQDAADNVLTLDLPFLTTGVYYLQLTDGNQQQVIPVVIDQS